MSSLDYSPTHLRVWNSMRLGWVKDCPTKFLYAAIYGWRSKREGFALRFGREYQYGLELYDRLVIGGDSHDSAVSGVVRTALERTWNGRSETSPGAPWGPTPEDKEPNRSRETLVRSLIWYLDHFKEDPAQTITLSSGKPAVELTFQMDAGFGPAEAGSPNYVFSGHLDRVVEFAGEKYIVDHKHTVKTLGSAYFSQYDMDNQMSLYSLASKVVFDVAVKGVMIDAAQVAVGFTRFDRGFTYRNDDVLNEWLDDARYWIGQAEYFSKTNRWPHNDRHCFLCEYKRICPKSPSMRETFLMSDFEKKIHDPLEIR